MIGAQNRNSEKALQWFDYALFIIVAAISFFLFQQGDILHTAGSSIGYLNGHILDFYEYNASFELYDAYLPTSYIIFAIWNIPVKILGLVSVPTMDVSTGVLLWYKLLPVLLYLLSGWLVYKIALEIGMGAEKSKLCAFVFVTTPIGFFSQFIFGQYDIFTTIAMLAGIYCYLKKKNVWFCLFFGLAITFKYFALLFFVLLLVLREKNIWKIIRNAILVILPFVVECLIYLGSPAFREYVFGFWATGYLFDASIQTTVSSISIVVLLVIAIFGWAYFTNPENAQEEVKWAFFLSGLIVFCIFGLSYWHPQWLLMGMPFLVLGAFLHKDTKIFMILDILLMLFYCIFVVNNWAGMLDENLFKLGVLGKTVDAVIGSAVPMNKIYVINDMNLVMSLFSGVLLVITVFKHPKYMGMEPQERVSCIGWIRTRFLLGVSIFIIPALISLSTVWWR